MTAPAAAGLARPPRIPKDPPPQLTASLRMVRLQDALRAGGTDGRTRVLRAFWDEVAAAGTPLVEAIPGDSRHRAVTFLWRDRHGAPGGVDAAGADGADRAVDGAGAADGETRGVVLLANKVTDPSVADRSVLLRIPGTDVWHRTYRMPADWRATYQLGPDDDVGADRSHAPGAAAGPRARWAGVAATAIPDPLCLACLPGKAGEPPLSVVELDEAPPQPWRDRRPEVPRGTFTEDRVPTDRLEDGPRRVWSYRPAAELVPDGAELGLLVLLDGEDWAGRLDIVSTLDNLLADGRIAPTAAVLVDAVDTPARWRDLACSDAFVDFLLLDLLPWARGGAGVTGDPSRTVMSGRSLGGLTALYAGLRAEGDIGAVHAQSPSLWWPAEPLPGGRRSGWLAEALAHAPRGRRAEVTTIEVGRQEWMLLDPARRLSARLRASGQDVRHADYEGGHDVLCWRGGLADALVDLAARPSTRAGLA